jgi:alkylation response protein AidB-like acyl-CoA dehydrogenase
VAVDSSAAVSIPDGAPEITAEQSELLDRARKVVAEVAAPALIKGERGEYFPQEIVPAFRDAGLVGGTIPVELGGLGWDLLTHMLVIEEVSKTSQVLGSYLAVANGPVGTGLMTFGTDEQKERWLRPLASGQTLAGYGLTEPRSGTDAARMATSARRTGDGWELNGSKRWIDWTGLGDFFLVFARSNPEEPGARGVTAFVVERDTPGFEMTQQKGKLGLRALTVGELHFDGCVVPDENRIGEEGRGFRVAMSALEETRLQIAARICGGLASCLELSVAHARERELFEHRLADFQLSQTKIADMVMAVQAARALTYQAARRKLSGLPVKHEVLCAKLFAQESYMRVAHDAVQLHGGIGIIDDSLVDRHYRDAKISELTGGTNEILRVLLAEQFLGRSR